MSVDLTMPTDEHIAAWEHVCEAATEGPWERQTGKLGEANPPMQAMVYEPSGPRVADCNGHFIDGQHRIANAEFIATARQALPALIATVRRLRAAAGAVDEDELS